MENIESKLGINEDGCFNLKAKSEGKSGDRAELERKYKKEHKKEQPTSCIMNRS